VFLISWVNPNGETRDKTFDDYLLEGPLAALDVIKDVTGQEEVNAMGYCLGGILLTVLLAWLEAKGKKPIRSATFMTTLVDYSDVGDIKVFVNDELVDRLEAVGRAKGFIPGDNVSWGFRMLRAPDLIWSFIINHYLLGKPRVPFDLCTGTRTRPTCRPPATSGSCATCISGTCCASRTRSRSPASRST
jgi:polyhydroxyalkanoate synthase subunit PhaC